MELDLQNPWTIQQYDGVPSLFANESEHMPCLISFPSSELRFTVRRRALALISHAKFSYNLDPLLVYLAVNYIDRFVSKHEILEKRPWISHILVVACLSLAAKMRNSDLSVILTDLTREEGLEFDARSVQRMEAIILSTLQWRMRSITPFSFLRYFISLLEVEDSSLTQALIHRASDIIFNVQHVLKISEHNPSTTSASALLCAIQDLMPHKISSSVSAISSCEYLDKDRLLECLGLMQEIATAGCEASPNATGSCTLTPPSVLDRQCTSSGSNTLAASSKFPRD
ncbi:putative cyclin-D6-1 [Primulina eburnea]|uniref:putative cyclin-D6-1 n=1 Tax=Primulina eburnea TaxID=1245227 RepID=UPI003C6C7B3D